MAACLRSQSISNSASHFPADNSVNHRIGHRKFRCWAEFTQQRNDLDLDRTELLAELYQGLSPEFCHIYIQKILAEHPHSQPVSLMFCHSIVKAASLRHADATAPHFIFIVCLLHAYRQHVRYVVCKATILVPSLQTCFDQSRSFVDCPLGKLYWAREDQGSPTWSVECRY